MGRGADEGEPSGAGATRDDATLLGAIVCPLIMRELPLAIANMALWQRELRPGAPLPGQARPMLIFSFNCAPDAEAERALREAFAAAPALVEDFAGIDVRFLSLPPERDRYIRKPTGPAPKYGYKSGPNFMFYETMRALRPEARFAFLMETDCTPLAPNWLRKIARTCQRHDDAWVIGAHYSGASPLMWRVARHINGNAIYQVGSDDFWTFMDEILWPWMLDYIDTHDPDLAYDCAWEAFLNREEMDYAGHHDWVVSRGVLHKFRLTDAIVNVGGHAEQSGHYIWTRNQLLARFPAAAIVHGPVTTGNAHRRGRYSIGRPTLSGVEAAEDGTLAFARDDAQFVRSAWPATGAFEKGQTLIVTFALAGAPGQVLALDLRDPSGRVIERKKTFVKEPGQRRVKGVFVVPERYNYLNIVLMVLREVESAAPMRVSDLTLSIEGAGPPVRIADFARG